MKSLSINTKQRVQHFDHHHVFKIATVFDSVADPEFWMLKNWHLINLFSVEKHCEQI
jgi:hypothetical protein